MHTTHCNTNFRHSAQRGFVLIVALVLLLVLTILGLAAAQSTSLEERMAGNARNRDLAFQAAQAALRAAEACYPLGLAMPVCSNFSANANGMYTFNPSAPPPPSNLTTPLWAVNGFWSIAGNVLSYPAITGSNLPYVAAQPEVIIEQMPPIAGPGNNIGQQQFSGGTPTIQLYRITAFGTGGDASATAILQAIN